MMLHPTLPSCAALILLANVFTIFTFLNVCVYIKKIKLTRTAFLVDNIVKNYK